MELLESEGWLKSHLAEGDWGFHLEAHKELLLGLENQRKELMEGKEFVWRLKSRAT